MYAAGDVASFPSARYGRRLRVEHWANALNGGPLAARAMLGQDVTYTDLPYFFTDQYDLGMEYTGWFAPGGYDQVVLRGDVDGLAFHAFWVAGDRVVAGMHVNLWDDGIGPVQELINSEQPVDAAKLADTSVPLADSTQGVTAPLFTRIGGPRRSGKVVRFMRLAGSQPVRAPIGPDRRSPARE